MKAVTLKRIGVLKIALISGVIYAILGVVVTPFLLISMAIGGDAVPILGMFLAFLFVPIVYAGLGFVACALAVGMFNLVAPRIGGVELQIETDAVATV